MILENEIHTVMEKMTERQNKTDELFFELETKRMKMEEQMYETEQKRLREERERQERERGKEREFQLKLYSMMCGKYQPMHNVSFPSSYQSASPYQLGPYPNVSIPASQFSPSTSFQSGSPPSPLFHNPHTNNATTNDPDFQENTSNACDAINNVDNKI